MTAARPTPGAPVFWTKGTGRGSEYWGGCDYCGRPMSEAFALWHANEHNGKMLAPNPMAYGHKDCVEQLASANRAAFAKAAEPAIVAPLTRICPNQRFNLLDDGTGELAPVSAAAWAAAKYHADN